MKHVVFNCLQDRVSVLTLLLILRGARLVLTLLFSLFIVLKVLEFSSVFLMPALCTFLESDNRAIYAMEHRPGTRGLLTRLHTKQEDDARAALRLGIITPAIKLTQIIHSDLC